MLRTILNGISNFFSSACKYGDDYLDSEYEAYPSSRNTTAPSTHQSVAVATTPSLHRPVANDHAPIPLVQSSSTRSVTHTLAKQDRSFTTTVSRRPPAINVTDEPGPSHNTRNCGVQTDLLSPGRLFISLAATQMQLGPPLPDPLSEARPATSHGCG